MALSIEDIRPLHEQHLSSRQIAKELGVHHRTIGEHLKRAGLRGNRDPRKKLRLTEDGAAAACTKCDKVKPLDEFHVQRSGAKYPYRLSYCDECRSAQTWAATRRSAAVFIQDRLCRVRLRAERANIHFDLSSEGMVARYNAQRGLCFYTDEPLNIAARTLARDSLSFDRVEPEAGYVSGNVVLCTRRANTIKHDLSLEELRAWMPGWYERVVDMWRAEGIACFQVAEGDF